MKKLFYIVVLLAAGFLGFLLWQKLFPSEETRVRNLLTSVAELATFPADEHRLVGVANANRLADRFTPDAEFSVELRGAGVRTLQGRDELLQAALAARANVKGLKIEFFDVGITLAPDEQTASVGLTAKFELGSDTDFGVQELKLQLKKVADDWFITRVETMEILRK